MSICKNKHPGNMNDLSQPSRTPKNTRIPMVSRFYYWHSGTVHQITESPHKATPFGTTIFEPIVESCNVNHHPLTGKAPAHDSLLPYIFTGCSIPDFSVP